MTRYTPAHLRELHELHLECQTAVQILAERGHLPDTATQMLSAVADTFAAQDLRGMRMVARDLRTMLGAVDPAERQSVEAEIELRIGRRAYTQRRDATLVAAIIARGSIRNDNEYHVLRSHLEELERDRPEDAVTEPVMRLLDSYRSGA